MSTNSTKKRNKERARILRKTHTDAEHKLWFKIRNRQILNRKFRRQYVFGKYIVDFVCIEKGLIVEIDGSQHLEVRQEYDARRTEYLNSEGYVVLRYWNNEVMLNMEGVLAEIYSYLV